MQLNTRYSETNNHGLHNLGSEDEYDVRFPEIKDVSSQHHSQRVIVAQSKTSPQKNVPIFGGAMVLYQNHNQEGAGVQMPTKQLK